VAGRAHLAGAPFFHGLEGAGHYLAVGRLHRTLTPAGAVAVTYELVVEAFLAEVALFLGHPFL
jgi:hypothetical protein